MNETTSLITKEPKIKIEKDELTRNGEFYKKAKENLEKGDYVVKPLGSKKEEVLLWKKGALNCYKIEQGREENIFLSTEIKMSAKEYAALKKDNCIIPNHFGDTQEIVIKELL